MLSNRTHTPLLFSAALGVCITEVGIQMSGLLQGTRKSALLMRTQQTLKRKEGKLRRKPHQLRRM